MLWENCRTQTIWKHKVPFKNEGRALSLMDFNEIIQINWTECGEFCESSLVRIQTNAKTTIDFQFKKLAHSTVWLLL